MKFSKLAEYLQKLESTTKRLEITDILTNLIRELNTDEIDKALYLTLGNLKAPFEGEKFNIAEKMMLKIISQTYSKNNDKDFLKTVNDMYKKSGDLGNVAYELSKNGKKSDLSVSQVYEKLLKIAKTEGTGSQEEKINSTADLLKNLDKLSAKYTIRIILGITRLGFTELTIMDALAQYLEDKNLRKEIEKVYDAHPDIGLISNRIISKGLKGIKDITVEPGVPIKAQKCQRLSSPEEAVEKMGVVRAEFKLDGTRVQLHLDRSKATESKPSTQSDLFGTKDIDYLIKTYTRNLEETTHQYPDIISAASKQVAADSVILDGEAIGYDKKTGEFLPFQETIQRKRKHGIGESAKNIPLKYFVFDILFLNGKSLMRESLSNRRTQLEKIINKGEVIVVNEYLQTDDSEKLQEYFDTARKKGLEGLILKKPGDEYQAGARSYSWVKLKVADQKLLEDSIDCVVLGYYSGRGVRSKLGIGGFLAGVLDPKTDVFKTISKIGTGLTDEQFIKMKEMCDKIKFDKKPANVELDKNLSPDVYVKPEIVVEIGADEISDSPIHTAGFALRFPRLLKFRDDKDPTEATTVEEIKKIYKSQKRGKY